MGTPVDALCAFAGTSRLDAYAAIAEAHGAQYATIEELAAYAPAPALAGLDDDARNGFLISASAFADGFLAAQYKLPLVRDTCGCYPPDLVRAVCLVATYDLVASVGYSPTPYANAVFRDGYEEAVAWLESVQSGDVTPSGIDDATATGTDRLGGARIASSTARAQAPFTLPPSTLDDIFWRR